MDKRTGKKEKQKKNHKIGDTISSTVKPPSVLPKQTNTPQKK